MKVLTVITDTDRRGVRVFADDLTAALNRYGYDSHLIALEPGKVGGLDAATLSGSCQVVAAGVFRVSSGWWAC